jgi:hypothetical protein
MMLAELAGQQSKECIVLVLNQTEQLMVCVHFTRLGIYSNTVS